jgi:hypothetical protein
MGAPSSLLTRNSRSPGITSSIPHLAHPSTSFNFLLSPHSKFAFRRQDVAPQPRPLTSTVLFSPPTASPAGAAPTMADLSGRTDGRRGRPR